MLDKHTNIQRISACADRNIDAWARALKLLANGAAPEAARLLGESAHDLQEAGGIVAASLLGDAIAASLRDGYSEARRSVVEKAIAAGIGTLTRLSRGQIDASMHLSIHFDALWDSASRGMTGESGPLARPSLVPVEIDTHPAHGIAPRQPEGQRDDWGVVADRICTSIKAALEAPRIDATQVLAVQADLAKSREAIGATRGAFVAHALEVLLLVAASDAASALPPSPSSSLQSLLDLVARYADWLRRKDTEHGSSVAALLGMVVGQLLEQAAEPVVAALIDQYDAQNLLSCDAPPASRAPAPYTIRYLLASFKTEWSAKMRGAGAAPLEARHVPSGVSEADERLLAIAGSLDEAARRCALPPSARIALRADASIAMTKDLRRQVAKAFANMQACFESIQYGRTEAQALLLPWGAWRALMDAIGRLLTESCVSSDPAPLLTQAQLLLQCMSCEALPQFDSIRRATNIALLLGQSARQPSIHRPLQAALQLLSRGAFASVLNPAMSDQLVREAKLILDRAIAARREDAPNLEVVLSGPWVGCAETLLERISLALGEAEQAATIETLQADDPVKPGLMLTWVLLRQVEVALLEAGLVECSQAVAKVAGEVAKTIEAQPADPNPARLPGGEVRLQQFVTKLKESLRLGRDVGLIGFQSAFALDAPTAPKQTMSASDFAEILGDTMDEEAPPEVVLQSARDEGGALIYQLLVPACQALTPSSTPLLDVRRPAHNLVGLARILGRADLADAAKSLEDWAEELEGEPALRSQEIKVAALGVLYALDRELNPGGRPVADDHLAVALGRFQSAVEGVKAFLSEAGANAGSMPEMSATTPSLSNRANAPSGPSATQGATSAEPLDLELVEIFRSEVEDLLGELEPLIDAICTEEGTDFAAINRILHTLKGGARMVGLEELGSAIHEAETAVEGHAAGRAAAGGHSSASASGAGRRLADELHSVAARTRRQANALGFSDSTASSLDAPGHAATPPPAAGAPHRVAQEERRAGERRSTSREAPRLPPSVSGEPSQRQRPVAKQDAPGQDRTAGRMVRLESRKLGDLAIASSHARVARERIPKGIETSRRAISDAGEPLRRLQALAEEISIAADSAISSGRRTPQVDAASPNHFDDLEMDRFDSVQELARRIKEAAGDVLEHVSIAKSATQMLATASMALNESASDLEDEVARLGQAHLLSIQPRLRALVNQVAKDVDKEAQFTVDSSLRIDRTTLEAVTPALEHLIRNSICHGIEPKATRTTLGKPPAGTLKLTGSVYGRYVELTLQDDGSGIDVERVKAKGLALGWIKDTEAVSDLEAVEMILRPGFTTATTVTQNAGRGVGMDAVKDMVTRAGGRMELHSESGVGLKVTLHLPVSSQHVSGLKMITGGHPYIVPSASIQRVYSLRTQDVNAALQSSSKRMTVDDGSVVEVASFSDVLGLDGTNARGAFTYGVVLRGTNKLLVVDQIEHIDNMPLKPFGPDVPAAFGLLGHVTFSDGAVGVVLSERVLLAGLADAQPRAVVAADKVRAKVLIADDSITVRRVLGSFLRKNNFDVLVAEDGRSAIQQLSSLGDALPDAIFLDVEMPQMDGFEALQIIKARPAWRHIPVAFISSRTATKHRTYASALGAAAFFGKPFKEPEVLAYLRESLGLKVPSGHGPAVMPSQTKSVETSSTTPRLKPGA